MRRMVAAATPQGHPFDAVTPSAMHAVVLAQEESSIDPGPRL